MRRDLAKLLEEAHEIPRSHTSKPLIEKTLGDIDIMVRYLDPVRDRDLVAEAAKVATALRQALEDLPVATALTACPSCRGTILRACNRGHLKVYVDDEKIELVTHFVVCMRCGDMRTFTDPTKLPAAFETVEATR